jgi:peptide/nickel transport system permease protein
VLGFIVCRLLWAAATVVLTAFFAYGIIRALRPDRYPPGESVLGGTWRDVRDALFRFTLGEDYVHEEFVRGWAADLYLLAGGLVVAVGLGVAGGVWCSARDRSRPARAVEGAAVLFLCTPVYTLALGTLLLFAPPFGLLQVPYFFDPNSYEAPQDSPWDFMRSMIVPWLVVGAPLAGMILRLTLALIRDSMGEHWVRTARAKGVPEKRVVRRHAAPASFVTVLSQLGASAPLMVMNVVLVEWVFSLPGFFRHMRRALGQNYGAPENSIDIPMLQGLAMWAAVLIVALSLVADLAIARVDPRIRSGGRPMA